MIVIPLTEKPMKKNKDTGKSKRFAALYAKIDKTKSYSVEEAIKLVNKHQGNRATWGRDEREELFSDESLIPEDAIAVTEIEVYLLDKDTNEIVLDENDMPVIDPDNKMFKAILPKEHDIVIEDVTSELEAEGSFERLRDERDTLLTSLDFTQLADAPITSEQKRLYREYRDYLRKLPSQYNDETVVNYKIESFQEWKNRVYPQ